MMTACADRMRRGACGDCARVDPCKALFARLFGKAPRRDRGRDRQSRSREPLESPLMTMLGQLARAMETDARAPDTGRRLRPPAHGPAPEGTFRREIEQRLEPMRGRGPVRIEEVARALGCSRQTLYRRLKRENVTFAGLLDGLRRRLGLLYVRERGMSVKEAAYRLGFSEPAAFSRAYKRWTGASPRSMNS